MVVELRRRDTLKKTDKWTYYITKSRVPTELTNYKAPSDQRVAKKKSNTLPKSKQRKTQAKRRRASQMTKKELELEREKEIMERALKVREQSIARRERAITRREKLLRAWELSYLSMQRTDAVKRVARVESNNTDKTQACPTAGGPIQNAKKKVQTKSKKVVKQDPRKKAQIDPKRKAREEEPEIEIISHYSVTNPKEVTMIDLTETMEGDGGEYEEEPVGTSETFFLGEEDIAPLRSAGSLLGRLTPPSPPSRGAATQSRHSPPNSSPIPSSTVFIELGSPILWECPRVNNLPLLPNLPWERSSGSGTSNLNPPSSYPDVDTQVNNPSMNGIHWNSAASQNQIEIETQAQTYTTFEWETSVYMTQLRNKPSSTSFRSAFDSYSKSLKKEHISTTHHDTNKLN